MSRSGVSIYARLALGCVTPALLAVCATPTRAAAADVPPTCTPIVARVVSMQGVVEIRRAGRQDWAPVTRLDTPMCQGDVVHAGPRSRAALVILPEKFVRLDQNSTVSISIEGDETVVEFFLDETTPRDACGAGYFITRFPRKFKVRTPFVNAAVEGTEFMVSMSCSATSVAVFEGKVSAQTLLANAERFVLSSGETLSAGPGEPPAIKVLVKPVDAVQWALYYPPLSAPGPGVGPDQQCDQSAPDERSRCLMVRAEQRLRVGRVDEAQADIDASLKLAPDNSDAEALLSVIDVAKNDRQKALALAQHATQLDPVNPRAWIALSYAQQASFKLEEALSSAERATELEPRSSIALTRVAELMMSLGKIRSALRAAQAAIDANPNDSRAHTILGFINLADIDIKKARANFEQAIVRDSSDPLPRLGLGLTIIRDGDLKAGREEIEIAVALDPTNSLLRSYVGKAYYEENTPARDKLAAIQFGLAEQLDPKDPTPWFYDATLKQTQNRPVEALHDLQESISLNDNRSVYRSRLLLDQDLAARSTELATTYNTLGFGQLGLIEGSKSVDTDPTNYSAHRLLADLFVDFPRHEVARVSELLQSQLWAPLTLNPLPPLLADVHPLILAGAAPSSVGMNEYAPLFTSNSALAQVYAVAGGQGTLGDQIIVSGLSNNFAFSLGQLHYETNYFRENSNLSKDILSGLFQTAPNYDTSLQLEVRASETQSGDLAFRFDPNNFFPTQTTVATELVRVGGRYRVDSQSGFIASLTSQSRRETTSFQGFPFLDATAQTGSGEAQYVYNTPSYSAILGGGLLDGNLKGDFSFFGAPSDNDLQGQNYYAYGTLIDSKLRARVELGLSYDHASGVDIGPSQNAVNPKFGLSWSPTPDLLLRLAWFRAMKRRLLGEQTLEPTQIAGFNQFYDDFNGTQAETRGIGLDYAPSQRVFAGVQISSRRLKVPQSFTQFTYDWYENSGLAYLYWVLSKALVVTVDYSYERFDRSADFIGVESFTKVVTQRVPISVNWFPFGPGPWTVKVTSQYVNQQGDFVDASGTPFTGQSNFWVTDVGITYQLPQRHGSLSLQVRNLFDKKFRFQETNFATPTLSTGQLILARLALQF